MPSWSWVLRKQRDCEWFERLRPGLSFERHIDIQLRRREQIVTAVIALSAAIIGGVLTMISVFITR